LATRIRLTRRGRKHHAIYRVVVADSRAPRDGKFLEQVGFYNPHNDELRFEAEAAIKWLQNGAIPSDRVLDLLKQSGVYAKFVALTKGEDVSNFVITPKAPKTAKRKLSPKAQKRAEAAAAAAAAPAAEAAETAAE
jgi:small subunit ribosomal protein S16